MLTSTQPYLFFGCVRANEATRVEQHPPWDARCEWNQLRRQCLDFKARLPRQHALTPQNIQAHISLKTSTPYVLVHTVYLLCQIMLHREHLPFVQLRNSPPDGPLEGGAEQLHLRVLAGVDLGEQQLDHRLVGGVDRLVELPDASADELMGIAYDNGINFFDNAEVYALGESEKMMGRVLKNKNWDRTSYVVSSKVFFGWRGKNNKWIKLELGMNRDREESLHS